MAIVMDAVDNFILQKLAMVERIYVYLYKFCQVLY